MNIAYLFCLLLISVLVLMIIAYFMSKLKENSSMLILILFIPTVLCGLIVYLIGYIPESAGVGDYVRAFLRALYSTGRMFSFNDDYGAINNKNQIVNSLGYTIVFWAAHVSALVIMVSAFFTIFGNKLVTLIKKFFKLNKDIYIIYGINWKSLSFAQNVLTKDDSISHPARDRYVLFIDENINQQFQHKVDSIGALYLDCPIFLGNSFNKSALLKAGFKTSLAKKIHVFAFTENDMINFNIIDGVLDIADSENISEKHLKGIYIHTDSDSIVEALSRKQSNKKYNFNYFCEADLAARNLFGTYPLYAKLAFDSQTGLPQGKKTLKILILGFGFTGKHILRQALYNGQFDDCDFEAIIIDKSMNDIQGQFKNNYPALFSEYKPQNLTINFIQDNVRSDDFYELLKNYMTITVSGNIFQIDYIVSTLGDDHLNFEVASDIRRFLKRYEINQLPTLSAHIADKVYKLFDDGINEDKMGDIIIFGDYDEIFTEGKIINEEMDKLAKAVNLSFGGSEWAALSTHKKNSNRASASFLGAYLYILGLELRNSTEIRSADFIIGEEMFIRMLKENDQLLENLGRTEHLRWNAFHYAYGWTKKTINKVCSYEDRIDEENKQHACIVPWEELITVKNKIIEEDQKSTSATEIVNVIAECDFQGKDRKNILSLHNIINEYNKKVADEKKLKIVKRR